MLKNISKLECKINERTFVFLADMDSPLAEVKEALFQFIKFTGDIEEAHRKKIEEESTNEELVESSM